MNDKLEFVVFNKETITNFQAEKPYIFISVRSPKTRAPQFRSNRNLLKVLYLQFHDADSVSEDKNIKLFTVEDADKILDFVEACKSRARIVGVNCEAGISRSAGIAGALAKIYNGDDTKFFRNPYTPNMLIYRTILERAVERRILK